MEPIIQWVVGNVSGLVLGSGVTLALAWLSRYIPKIVIKETTSGLAKAMASIDKIEDPMRKEKVMKVARALVEWAEFEIPDKGKGRARYDAVAQKLVALIPALKGRADKIADIIESAVVAMDDELKKAAK